jgi:hypothetical protein
VADKITAMNLGRLSLSRISYFCDLQRASGRQIPLGVIAEITVGNIRTLGLIGRTRLHPHELTSIGALIRDRLHNPFEFMKEEFDWAWTNSEAGTSLQTLAARHNESYFISPPDVKVVRGAGVALEFAKRKMQAERDAAFFSFLNVSGHPSDAAPSDEFARLAA